MGEGVSRFNVENHPLLDGGREEMVKYKTYIECTMYNSHVHEGNQAFKLYRRMNWVEKVN